MFDRKQPYTAKRGMHLDLKGTPPTGARLRQLPQILSAMHFNCVLVEYNVMFPWTRGSLRDKDAYTPDTVKSFLKAACKNGIEVIPLIQSLGHIEIICGKPEFAHLREAASNPGEVCASNPESRELVAEMLNDIIKLHEGQITHLHLGGDEAWTLGSCPQCKKFIADNGTHGRAMLYYRHIEPLLDVVNNAGVRPILWADMMREWPLPELKKLARKCDLMEWGYSPQKGPRDAAIKRFKGAGISLWGASAFKGASGCCRDRPDVPLHVANNLAWAAKAREYRMSGVIATGWSRYSDFWAQCESLESSMDSLCACSAVLWDGKAPRDPEKAAREFLCGASLRRLCGKKTLALIDAASDLAQWQVGLTGQLAWIQCLYPFNGERECPDMRQLKVTIKWFASYIEKGEILLERWGALHKGLVPDSWLKRYFANRLEPLKMLEQFFKEKQNEL